ncbi:MAG TPA: hypothetical protein VMT96_00640 [Candidatus Bathyarchaeia archaeon]|nr:hypothetical protein [Candidatus Bathyarchaeia archaeon]
MKPWRPILIGVVTVVLSLAVFHGIPAVALTGSIVGCIVALWGVGLLTVTEEDKL